MPFVHFSVATIEYFFWVYSFHVGRTCQRTECTSQQVQILRFWILSIVLLSKMLSCLFSKTMFQRLESASRLQVRPTQMGPIDSASPYSRTQLIRSYLKTETESSLRNITFWKINSTAF
jgi:hypothetical protein